MRRMVKEAAYAEKGSGGLLSKSHDAAGAGDRTLAVISRTTAPVWTEVTWGTTFREAARRSAVTQFFQQDCDANTGLIASTLA